jgi:hypothetical protein
MNIIKAEINNSEWISVKFNTYIYRCTKLNGYHYCQREFKSDVLDRLVLFKGILYKTCENESIYVHHFLFFTFEPV